MVRTSWFELNPGRLARATSDSINIVRKNTRTEIRRHFFSNRVAEGWNPFPTEVKNAHSASIFKKKVCELLQNKQ